MELFQCFICYFLGTVVLVILNLIFGTSDKLYRFCIISSVVGGVFLFIFAVVGYKFATVDVLSSFIVGLSGIFGLIMTAVFNLIF